MKLLESETLSRCEDPLEVLLATPRCQMAMMVLEPGLASGEYGNSHPNSDQIFYVIDGEGELIVRRESTRIKKGDLILVEGIDQHQIIGGGERAMRILTLVAPPAR